VYSVSPASSEERPHLSVVVPAYNEACRLERPLRMISDHLASRPYSAEIVLVDDGSEDGTFELVSGLAKELKVPVRAFRYRPNRGKGHALKVGFSRARGDRVLFTDADLATPIQQLDALNEAIDLGYDIAIGSRKEAGADIRVHQPWYRERMGKVFTWLVRSFLADVSDATCGFKMFRGDIGRSLFAQLRIDDWAFDAELLLLARRGGHRIREVPVRWEDQPGTKVRLFRDAWRSACGLLKIVCNDRRGLYDAANEVKVQLEVWPPEDVRVPDEAGPKEALGS
jgi:dolichyl-phosphate beta-glucosyltransferase